MKRCTYCGREHPDEATACSLDQQPLEFIASPSATLKSPDSQPSKGRPPQVVVPAVLCDADMLDIAKCQKAIIWLILLSIPAYVAALAIPILPLVAAIISLIFIYKLAAALKESAPWLYVVLGVIPCISLIALLVINSRATSALKARGIRVGLMGADETDLLQLKSGKTKLEIEQEIAKEKCAAVEDLNYQGPRCVSCSAPIQTGVALCSKCGWRQPISA